MARHEIGTHIDGDNPRIKCECGREFPATVHPVESDNWESPEWYAHVREHRHRRHVTKLRAARRIATVDYDDPDAVANAIGRLMRLVNER
jgi:hypothetical protein